MPDRMKHQEMWGWAIEAYDPPGVLTRHKLRKVVENLKGVSVHPFKPLGPIMVHPDAWKALQKMDEALNEMLEE